MWRPCGIFDAAYEKDMAIVRTSRHWTALVISLVILFLVPVFGSYYIVSFTNYLAISVIVVLGLPGDVRLTTSPRVWDEPSWRAFEQRSQRVEDARDEAAVRAALRWALD